MKHLLKTTIATLAAMISVGGVSQLQGAPLLTITDNLDLYVTGQAQEAYNSNILSAASVATGKKQDWITTLAPGVELDYGRNTATTVKVSFYENFLIYANNSNLNTQLANVFLDAEHQQGAWDVKANLSWQQLYTNTPSSILTGVVVNAIVRQNVSNAGFKVHYDISPKFNTDLGFQYTGDKYGGSLGGNYQSLQTYYVPANFYYTYSEKFDIGAAYYLNYQVPDNSLLGPGVTRYDNFIGATARIRKWEKITGSVNLGGDFNHIDSTPAFGGSPAMSAQNHAALAYGIKLQYDFSPKLSFFLNGERNYTTGALGQNIQQTTVNLTGHYQFSDFVSFDGTMLGYSDSLYLNSATPTNPTRNDDAYNFGFQANWTPTTYLILSAGYTYFLNDSNIPGNTYNINMVTLSANVRY